MNVKQNMTRREFIKTVGTSALVFSAAGFLTPEKLFAADSDLSVKTRYGTFRGFLDEKGVKTWLGIPYAKPPVKKLRWQNPQKPDPTDKTFDAKKFGASAIQEDDKLEAASKSVQSEDCLTLNIWKHSDKKNLPVIVFIHGGSFMHGGTSDPFGNGNNLAAANDIIVVTINYRLNIFGFMNFAAIDPAFADSDSCLGLKDQVAALKWVRENISEFGGNPDNITICGESAGSLSTLILMVSPFAKGLFRNAIPESGSTGFMQSQEHTLELVEAFMKLSGTRKMSDLMKKSSNELREIYLKLFEMRKKTAHFDFVPASGGAFLPKEPFDAIRDGDAKGIRLMTGVNACEWGYWKLYDENYFKNFRETHEIFSPISKRYKKRTSKTDMELYKYWLQGRPDNEDNYMEFINQADWRVSQELDAENQSKYEDVYYYLFSETTPMEELGSFHSLELAFVFDKPYGEVGMQRPDPVLVRQIQASWASFAATGNPNNEFIPHWEKYSADNRQTMELNSKGCVCRKDMNTENLNVLRHVIEG